VGGYWARRGGRGVGTGKYVFLSYSRANAEAAEWLRQTIEQLGVNAWRDTDEIAVGSWRAEIDRGIANAAAVFVIATPASLASIEVSREILAAADLKKPIVPVLLEPVAFPDGVRNVFAGLQVIQAFGDEAAKAPARIAMTLSQLGLDVREGASPSPIAKAAHQQEVRPAFTSDLSADQAVALFAEAERARGLAPNNPYTQLSAAVLLLHMNDSAAALNACRPIAAAHPANGDALHFLSVAELCACPGRRMSLAQVEAVEQRSVRAAMLSGQAHHLLPLGAVTADYRVRFGGLTPYGGASQIAARIRAGQRQDSEIARFFSLVRTDFVI
jgi:TIR domain-containing protein